VSSQADSEQPYHASSWLLRKRSSASPIGISIRSSKVVGGTQFESGASGIMLVGAGIWPRYGHPPSSHHRGSGLLFSGLELQGRISACLLDSPSTNAAMRALLLGAPHGSTATCKSPPPQL
jgi:hypothetical protein